MCLMLYPGRERRLLVVGVSSRARLGPGRCRAGAVFTRGACGRGVQRLGGWGG